MTVDDILSYSYTRNSPRRLGKASQRLSVVNEGMGGKL